MSRKIRIRSPEAARPTYQGGQELASRARRFSAGAINFLIGIAFFIAGIFALKFGWLPKETAPPVLFIVLNIFVQIGFIHRYGQTIGKKIMGIRAVDIQTGKRLSTRRYCTVREPLAWLTLPFPPYGIGCAIFMFLDWIFMWHDGEQRRSIEDHFAKTVVIKLPHSKEC